MKKPWRLVAYALGGILGVWLLAKFLLPIGLPFLLGFGLSRIAEPFVRRLTQTTRLPRWLASFLCVSAVYLLLGVILWALGKTLFSQLWNLAQQLPALISSLSGPVSSLHAKLLLFVSRLPDGFATIAAQWLDRFFAGSTVIADTASQWILSFVTGTISSLPNIVMFTLSSVLSSYLLSSGFPALCETASRLFPESWKNRLSSIGGRLKIAGVGYCKAQLRLMPVTFGIVTAGLLLLRVDYAFLIGILIAIVDALPVFGSGAVLIPWAVLAFARGDNMMSIGLLITYATASLTRTFLEPRFLGKQIGLSPLFTLMALYAGWRLFGILGMILLPVAVILCKQLYDLIETAQ